MLDLKCFTSDLSTEAIGNGRLVPRVTIGKVSDNLKWGTVFTWLVHPY